jgi:hypothetical protein
LKLADDVIAQIERRRISVRDRLDRLIERRDAMSDEERTAARDSLRDEGREIVGELSRLDTAASLTCEFLALKAREMRDPVGRPQG